MEIAVNCGTTAPPQTSKPFGRRQNQHMKQSAIASEPLSNTTPPTTNKHLIRWVEKMADLTQPAAIRWVDGSQEEYDRLCREMVE